MADADKKQQAAETMPSDIAKLSFEDAMAELEEIVRRLEHGEGDLDSAIEGYTRGSWLKRHCEAKLKEAEAKIEKIVPAADGTVAGSEPLDPE